MNQHQQISQAHTDEASPSLPQFERLPLQIGSKTTAEVEAALAQASLFVLKQPALQTDGASVFITCSQPGPFTALKPLIDQLLLDPRVSNISYLGLGPGKSSFANSYGDRFTAVNGESDFRLSHLLDTFAETRPSIIVATNDSGIGPQLVAHGLGKSFFKAKTLALIAESPDSSLGLAYHELRTHPDIAPADLILCNDDLTKKVVACRVSGTPPVFLLVTGTGQLDSLQLDRKNVLRSEGRASLGLDETDRCVIFLGDISSAYQQPGYVHWGIDPEINEKGWGTVVQSLCALAAADPAHQYRLLLRPHPRDPNIATLYEFAEESGLPANLQIVDALRQGTLQINHAVYASDTLISGTRTEIFKAPYRGIPAIFLGLQVDDAGEPTPGLGATVVEKFEPPIREGLFGTQGITVALSPRGLRTAIHDALNAVSSDGTPAAVSAGSSSGPAMVDALFAALPRVV